MKNLIISACLLMTISSQSMAQDDAATDLSRYEIFEDGDTIKTLTELQVMEDAYLALVADGNCTEAIPEIIRFYEAANQVSNLIRRGNEPYYSARRDDQDSIARSSALLNELVKAENTFNRLLRQRNRAWVEEAKCLLSMGEKRQAVTRLFRALDYIGGSERELWEEARTLLWGEVGFNPQN